MSEQEFCEYAVLKKKEGAYLAKICITVALTLVFTVCFFLLILPKLGFVVGAVILAAVGFALWYLSRYTHIEYEYCVSGGFMDFAAVYAKQYRKELLSVDLKQCMKKTAPYENDFDGVKVSKITDLRSSKTSENSYYMIYEAEKENATHAVLFDANEKCVDALFRTLPSAVTRKK